MGLFGWNTIDPEAKEVRYFITLSFTAGHTICNSLVLFLSYLMTTPQYLCKYYSCGVKFPKPHNLIQQYDNCWKTTADASSAVALD